MNSEIRIGKVFNVENSTYYPKKIIVINDAQREIIIRFAEKRIDEDGFPIYKINGCEFSIALHFGLDKYFKEAEILRARKEEQAWIKKQKLEKGTEDGI